MGLHIPGLRSLKTLDVNQTVNNSTTLVTMTDGTTAFSQAIGAGKKILLRISGKCTTGATPGLKIQFTVPASPTVYRAIIKLIAGTSYNVVDSLAAQGSVGAAAAIEAFEAELYLVNGVNAGTITVQFAQQAADASDTILLAGATQEITLL